MEWLSWRSIGFYCVFGVLVYYQRMHAERLPGPPPAKMLLTALAYLGMFTGFAYLVYYGLTIAWWAALVPLAMSALATIPAILLERLVGPQVLGLLAVPGWPLCAYLMFRSLGG